MSSEPSAVASDNDVAIRIEGLSKCFAVYHSPLERLKHLISPGRQKGFNEFWALRDVDLVVRRGETCAIVGRNGSGKSTLLQILCGTLRGTTGRVSVRGRVAALLELGAGFNTDFTGRENVYMNGAVLGLTRAEIDARMPDIEAFAEIGDFIDQPVKTYSSGMYVRLAFSVAIHVEPQILIVDEALAVGDSRFQAKCMNRIQVMKESGVTILFVSHDVGAVRMLCESALWLDKGQVRMLGDAFPVTAQYNQFLFEAENPEGAAGSATTQETVPADECGGSIDSVASMATRRPINHWGSHIGSILDAGVYNAAGERAASVLAGEEIEIRVTVRPPANARTDTLSVAFSIKDLRGTDLIVSTTWDDKSVDFGQVGEAAEVRFRMRNPLNQGNYLLVAALEDRAGAMPQYYEYVEGAHYFTCFVEQQRYGAFLPEIVQSVATAPIPPTTNRALA